MEMRSAVQVNFDVADRDTALLDQTAEIFLWLAQYVVDHALECEYITTNEGTPDAEAYEQIREKTNGSNGESVQAVLACTKTTWKTEYDMCSYVECGDETRADATATKNIGTKSLHHTDTGGDGGAILGVPVNNAPMTLNGAQSPDLAEARTGGNAESHRLYDEE